MSEPNSPKTSGLTHAQALFAVLAGASQARRDRVYYRDKALRSSLYPIPDIDGVTASSFSVDSSNLFLGYTDYISTSQFEVDEISLRTTQLPLASEDVTTTAQFSIESIELRTTQLTYKPSQEVTNTTQYSIDTLTLTKVLIRHVDPYNHPVTAAQFAVDSITLS